MAKFTVIDPAADDLKGSAPVSDLVRAFAQAYAPLEQNLHVLIDTRTGARYVECHIRASNLVSLSTIDVPLDPDEQSEYRANREIVEDHFAFERMKVDACARRTFINIVIEYSELLSTQPLERLEAEGGRKRICVASPSP